ncbi:MAG: DUF4160 domain-containing protein [bacterium]|nr:DUF4160 domain-containing protein [bacterium]
MTYADKERLGDEIAAHLDAATHRLLVLIGDFDAAHLRARVRDAGRGGRGGDAAVPAAGRHAGAGVRPAGRRRRGGRRRAADGECRRRDRCDDGVLAVGRAAARLCAHRLGAAAHAAGPGVAPRWARSDRPEPAHVHVEGRGGIAEFWLRPIRLAASRGRSRHELSRLAGIVAKHQGHSVRAWNDYFKVAREPRPEREEADAAGAREGR